MNIFDSEKKNLHKYLNFNSNIDFDSHSIYTQLQGEAMLP